MAGFIHIRRFDADNYLRDGKSRNEMETASPIAEQTAASASGVWQWCKPIDIGTVREFHAAALDRLRSTPRGPMFLDLLKASHMDACGLQLLVVLAVHAITDGRKFEISNASDAIERDLQLSGVAYLLRQD